MSNVGINIWTVGDALENPELGGGIPQQIDTGPISLGGLSTAGGDTEFAQAIVSFGFSTQSGDSQAEASITFSLSVSAGDYSYAESSVDLGQLIVEAAGETQPDLQGGNQALRGIEVEAVGYTWGVGGADLDFPISVFSGDESNVGSSHVSFDITVSASSEPIVFHGLAWIPGIAGFSTGLMLDEGVNVSAAFDLTAEMVLRTYMQVASDDAQILGTYIADLDEELVIAVASTIPHTIHIVESLAATADHTFLVTKIIDLIDELELSVSGDMLAAYRLSFAHALLVASQHDFVDTMTVSEVLQAAVDHPLQMRYIIDMMEAVAAAHTDDFTATFMVEVDEGITADQSMDFLGAFKLLVEESIWPYATFQVGDDVIQGWVMNAASQGFSEYQNFPFNSLVEANGRYYGMSADGLYLLEGDDDAGEPIEAVVRTGLIDMGSHYLKGAHAAYVGYTSTGQMVLKVVTTDQGQKTEWWYELNPATADEMRDGRVMLGRGLRARYWQFEIVNAAGADFDVDDVTLLYQVLNRRIR